MVKNENNEQFDVISGVSHSDLNDIRKELDAKIDNKLSVQIFIGLVAVFALIIVSAFGFAFIQIGNANGKLDDVIKRTTVIEIKLDERKNSPR